MPRATTAACDVLPPRLVRMPCAAKKPWMSSGFVSSRTRITLVARVRPRCSAVSASNTMLPEAAPGDAGRPWASDRAACVGSSVGTSSCSSSSALMRVERPVLRDQPLREHPDRARHHRPRVHLAVAGLQAIEPAALDRELEVLHFLVVASRACRAVRRAAGRAPGISCAIAAIGFGVRMPATTSSPCAFTRYSP